MSKKLFNERLNSKTTVEIFGKEPVIYVDVDALGKMKEYVDGCSDEIGWLGEVTRDKDVYVIEDVHLFKQEVHATTCEITTEGLTDFANELLVTPDGMDRWNNIKAWFHSHVNMGVSPSSQDESQMNVFKDCGHDFFIRAIANKKGEMEFTIYDYEKGLKYKDVKWKTLYRNAEINQIQQQMELLKRRMEELSSPNIDKDYIKEEMKQKVSKKTYGVVRNVGTTYGNYGGYSGYGNAYGQNWDDWYGNNSKKNEVKETNKNIGRVVDSLIDEYKCGMFMELEETFTPIQIQTIGYSDVKEIKELFIKQLGEAITDQEALLMQEHCADYTELLTYV